MRFLVRSVLCIAAVCVVGLVVPVRPVGAEVTTGDTTSTPVSPTGATSSCIYATSTVVTSKLSGASGITWGTGNPQDVYVRCYIANMTRWSTQIVGRNPLNMAWQTSASAFSGQFNSYTCNGGVDFAFCDLDVTHEETFGNGSGFVEFTAQITNVWNSYSNFNGFYDLNWSSFGGFGSWTLSGSRVGSDVFLTSFPANNYGFAVQGSFDPCGDIELYAYVIRKGDQSATQVQLTTAAQQVNPGDTLRLTFLVPSLPVDPEDEDADEFLYTSLRWSPSHQWSSAYERGYPYTDDEWPSQTQYWVVPSTGPSFAADSIQVKCWTSAAGSEAVYWSPISGFSDNDAAAGCGGMEIRAIEFRETVGETTFDYSLSEAPAIMSGDSVEIDVQYSGASPDTSVLIEYAIDGDWFELVSLSASASVPGVVTFGLSTNGHAWVRPRDLRLRCTDGGGSYEVDPATGDQEPVTPDEAAGCYGEATSDMSYLKPWTWVRGAGRMGVCLVTWLVVPEDGAIQDAWSDVTTEAQEAVPFAWVYQGHEVAVDATNGLAAGVASTSGDCFTVVPSPESITGESGTDDVGFCPGIETGASGSWSTWAVVRNVLGIAVWVGFALWLSKLVWGAGSGQPAQPEQLTLF